MSNKPVAFWWIGPDGKDNGGPYRGMASEFAIDNARKMGCEPQLLYAALVPTPATVPDGDNFNGSTPHLIQCMESLVHLDKMGVLVPHGIGGHASVLLSAAANRLRQKTSILETQATVPDGWSIRREGEHIVIQKSDIGGVVVKQDPSEAREIPEAILWALANDLLQSAQEPKS